MGDFFVRMKSCKTSENTVKKMAKLILLFTFFKTSGPHYMPDQIWPPSLMFDIPDLLLCYCFI